MQALDRCMRRGLPAGGITELVRTEAWGKAANGMNHFLFFFFVSKFGISL